MNIARLAVATAPIALLLAGCGDAQDASEDAMAETVEMPADEAMADAPMPAEDVDLAEDDAQEAPSVEAVEQSAQQAADDAQAAVDDAIAAAEDTMD